MTKVHQVLAYAPLLILVALIVYTLAQWQGLPAQIPTHFNLRGKPDDFGPRNMILLLPAIGIFLMVMFRIAISQLGQHNKSNDEKNKTSTDQQRIMMHVLSALVMLLFFFITYGTVQVAHGLQSNLSSIIIFGIVALMLLSVGFFSWRGSR
jgi:uncharacterized membrane protein